MRKFVVIALLVGGIAAIVAGVGSATWWKPNEVIRATAHTSSESGSVVTAPGVLSLVDGDVNVVARAGGEEVELVVAPTSTITDWLGEAPYEEITGLADWETLKVADRNGDGEVSEATIAESDLFNPDNIFTGSQEVAVYFTVPEGNWSILARTSGGVTPTIELTWEREVETPWLWRFVIPGVIAFALGTLLYFLPERERTATKVRAGDGTVGREELASETNRGLGAAIVPASPRAKELREAPLDPADRIVLLEDGGESEETVEAGGAGETEGTRQELASETNRGLGAAIVPASPRAKELREAPLDPADRIVLLEGGGKDEESAGGVDARGAGQAREDHGTEEQDTGGENLETGDTGSESPGGTNPGDDSQPQKHEPASAPDHGQGAEQAESGDAADPTDAKKAADESERGQAVGGEQAVKNEMTDWRSLWGFGSKEK